MVHEHNLNCTQTSQHILYRHTIFIVHLHINIWFKDTIFIVCKQRYKHTVHEHNLHCTQTYKHMVHGHTIFIVHRQINIWLIDIQSSLYTDI